MKSAYELAMERLQKDAPTIPLSDAQKAEIAERESTCRAKIAEQELFLTGQIANARAEGKVADAASLQKQLAYEMTRIREDYEAKKQKVRAARSDR